MKHEYAKFVPESLINIHQREIENHGEGSKKADIYCKLLSKENELESRKVLYKIALLMQGYKQPLRKEYQVDDAMVFIAGSLVHDIVESALHAPAIKKTKKEKEGELLMIAKRADELSKLIGRNQHFQGRKVFQAFTTAEILELSDKIKPEEFRFPKLRATVSNMLYLLPDKPTFESILNGIAEEAQAEAKKEPLVPKTKNENYELVYFIRSVYLSFMAYFQAPLHEHNAALARIFFDDPSIDKLYVQATTRGLRKRAMNPP